MGRPEELGTIVVDLTPVRPGGENGGAKILAVRLIPLLARLAPKCEFILLTSQLTHNELAAIERPNVRRFCVDAPTASRSPIDNTAVRAAATLSRVAPARVVRSAAAMYHGIKRFRGEPSLLQRFGAGVLFCPFMAPSYDDGEVPFVSSVHDLQFSHFPEFFEPDERKQLEKHFRRVSQKAARIICGSEYVRKAVAIAAPASRVTTIHYALRRRTDLVDPRAIVSTLARWQLNPGRYLLYPANFWPHKNHTRLLEAFRTIPDLKLVLTGAEGPARDQVIAMARAKGLSARVEFPGFIPDEDFAVLLSQSLALIFPSLFEGFGIPVLEAMAAGIPVLCSNLTSLPEITAGAALLFDPLNLNAIAGSIRAIDSNAALRAQLVAGGRKRAASFGTEEEMAGRYLAVLSDAARQRNGAEPESPNVRM